MFDNCWQHFAPNPCIKTPLSRPVGHSTQTYSFIFEVLRWTMRFLKKSWDPPKNGGAPLFLLKTAQIGQTWHFLWFIWWSIAVFRSNLHFSRKLIIQRRTTNVIEIFWKKRPSGQDMEVYLWSSGEKQVQIWKKGTHVWSYFNLNCIFRHKIRRKLGFCYETWPN